MTERLKSLEQELQSGIKMLSDLDQRRGELRDTLLRITGAIEILRELSESSSAQVLAMAGD